MISKTTEKLVKDNSTNSIKCAAQIDDTQDEEQQNRIKTVSDKNIQHAVRHLCQLHNDSAAALASLATPDFCSN